MRVVTIKLNNVENLGRVLLTFMNVDLERC